MKRTFLPAALLAAAIAGCGGGEPAVDDTASPAVEGIPKISGETTAETPGGEPSAPAPVEPAPAPETSSPDPGAPPPPPADPAPAPVEPPVTPPSP